MSLRAALIVVVSGLFLAACEDVGSSMHVPEDAAPSGDQDGDGIPDGVEGFGDADGDGLPDSADSDADGDGIADAIETTEDADHDGVPNYLDLDSDQNGIPDAEEGVGDSDGDLRHDFRDLDDDNDRITDARELAISGPADDADGDGAPNWRDRDSDDDTIDDEDEWGDDCDGDGTADALDTDSDDDGWLDAEEAGDASRLTRPIDTDADGWSDGCDPDSDGDSLLDADERARGTARLEWDTDGDGAADPIELREGTDPLDPTSVALLDRAVFVMPYLGPCTPSVDIRTVLGDEQPLEPSVAHISYSTTDPETVPWLSYVITHGTAGDDCAPRSPITVVRSYDGYADARRGDVLCWNVAASSNGTMAGAERVATMFEGRVTVEIEGGVPVVHPVYWFVPGHY